MSSGKDVPLSVPVWADFFDANQYAGFLAVLDDEMLRRGWQYALEEGAVVVSGGRGECEESTRFGLVDLAKKCLQSLDEAERWPDLVRDHFDSLVRSGGEMAALERMSFEEVRAMLRVRLYPPGLAAAVGGDRLVRREVAPCLDEVLVVDLPSVVVTVKPEIVERWGRSMEELFRLGRENLSQEQVRREKVKLDGDVVIELLEGDSHFVASQVLVLDLDPDIEAPFGALVAIPNRHALALHLIRDLEVQAEATRVMLGWLAQAHHEGPGSISPHLYWLTPDNQLLQFETSVSADGGTVVTPPQRFLEQVLLPLSHRSELGGN